MHPLLKRILNANGPKLSKKTGHVWVMRDLLKKENEWNPRPEAWSFGSSTATRELKCTKCGYRRWMNWIPPDDWTDFLKIPNCDEYSVEKVTLE